MAVLGLWCRAQALPCCVQAFSSCSEQGILCSCSTWALIATASLVEHRLWGTQASVVVACGLLSSGSAAVVHAFSCPVACGIWVPGSGIKPPVPYFGRWTLNHGHQRSPSILMPIALWYSLKSESMMLPALFSLLQDALAIQGLLYFHTNFGVVYSTSVKTNVIGILIGTESNL